MTPTESRKALFIGIDNYEGAPLRACVNDARMMKSLLETHEDGESNFKPRPIDYTINLSNERIKVEIERLLKPERAPQHALFYFSGHGTVQDGVGYFVGRDYSKDDWGVSMSWLTEQLNESNIPEITVILDCCFSGVMELPPLSQNRTILASTTNDDTAEEGRKHGFFTDIILQGLNGAAADAFGYITANGLYTLAASAFSSWQQSPVYMSRVTQMRPLRKMRPLMQPEEFRKLISRKYFPNSSGATQLNPSDICIEPGNPKQIERFSNLLKYQQARLIECPNGQTIYEAAMAKSHYQLSAFGEFFKEMVRQKKY